MNWKRRIEPCLLLHMAVKLEEKTYKGNPLLCTLQTLLKHLKEEVEELEQTIKTNKPLKEIWREAADVALSAQFIAQKTEALHKEVIEDNG